jgi:hypothetical protein
MNSKAGLGQPIGVPTQPRRQVEDFSDLFPESAHERVSPGAAIVIPRRAFIRGKGRSNSAPSVLSRWPEIESPIALCQQKGSLGTGRRCLDSQPVDEFVLQDRRRREDARAAL